MTRAEPADLEAIRPLDGLSASTVRLLANDLAAADRVCVLARDDDTRQVLGYAAAVVQVGECQLLDVAVATGARRQGVASALLEAIDVQARARGATATTLEVAAGNLGAQALYRRHGFVVEGRRVAYYPDGQDALIMWRRDPASTPTGTPTPTRPATPPAPRATQGD